MKLTAREIAALVEGKVYGNPEALVTGAAGLDEAAETDVSFLGNQKYLPLVFTTKAGVLFLPEKLAGLKKTIIAVKNPQLAFAKVLTVIEKERKPISEKGINATAIIGRSVTLGHEITIGPFTVIEDNAHIGNSTKILAQVFIGSGSKIGHGCLIYPNVTIGENITIGNNVIIHSGTVIGSDGFGFVPTSGGHFKIPQLGSVEIGDDVELGSNVSIDRATTGKTKIGKGTKIDNLVHIAHNVQIGEHCLITGQNGFAGSAVIGNFVTFGAQAGVGGHLKIGDGAIIAARAGVTADVGPNEVVSGFPARRHKDEMKKLAIMNKLPEMYDEYKKGKGKR